MVQLCFVLDLRSFPPSLLGDIKQSLLQLANFYAISSLSSSLRKSNSLEDRIGLCYVFRNSFSSFDELKIAYRPRESFNLRDFHHAINHLPSDAFLPQIYDSLALSYTGDLKLSTILSDQVLYSWGTGKDIERKVVVLSSCFPEEVDSIMRKSLMDAADQCVSVEFLSFEHKSGHLTDTQQNVSNFFRCISDMDNCSFHTYLPDFRVLHGLIKRWKADLEADMKEPLQARFLFENSLVGSVNQIFCNLYISVNKIIDGFSPCQTCRCHGILLEDVIRNRTDGPSCSVTGHELGKAAVIENSVKVGENIILFVPSLQSSMKSQKIASPIDFNVVERINLGSLSEGSVMGDSYVVIPSAGHEIEATSDDIEQLELNAQRSEEVSCIPDFNHCIHSLVTKEIQESIQCSLSKIELKDYDPLVHERGFHQKLNLLVYESLQFGSVPPKYKEVTSKRKLTQQDPLEEIVQSNSGPPVVLVEEESPKLNLPVGEDKTSDYIAEEWEQLVVNEVPKMYSPACSSRPELYQSVLSPANSDRQLDVKTTRILERLEVPRQLKRKAFSPLSTSSGMEDPCVLRENIPRQSIDATASQLIKPNFQRIKRKHK